MAICTRADICRTLSPYSLLRRHVLSRRLVWLLRCCADLAAHPSRRSAAEVASSALNTCVEGHCSHLNVSRSTNFFCLLSLDSYMLYLFSKSDSAEPQLLKCQKNKINSHRRATAHRRQAQPTVPHPTGPQRMHRLAQLRTPRNTNSTDGDNAKTKTRQRHRSAEAELPPVRTLTSHQCTCIPKTRKGKRLGRVGARARSFSAVRSRAQM